MTPDVKKIREMLDALTTKDWSWSGRTEEPDEDMPGGVFIWHPQGSYLGNTMICLADTYEDDHKDLDFIAAAPTLLREACERIESLEELHEIVRWEKECEEFQRPPSRKFQTHLGHIPWLDAKKAKENWQSKGWRSLARIYGNAWMQKQDALSALGAADEEENNTCSPTL